MVGSPLHTAAVQSYGGVLYLPVAPQITALSRFSPMLPRRIPYLMPEEALTGLTDILATRSEQFWMAAVVGPGDPLAVPDTLLRTIAGIRNRFPHLAIGVRTVGIGSRTFAGQLAEAGVDLVEMEVNGVRQEILEAIYAWIRPGLKTISLAEGVALLLEEQKHGVAALRYHDVEVRIVTTLYPGQNIHHVGQIASAMAEVGARSIALLPYRSAPGVEVLLPPVEMEMQRSASRLAAKYLPVVDAELRDFSPGVYELSNPGSGVPKPTRSRPNVAVVSTNGIDIDLHLGHAQRFLVYGPRDDDGLSCLLETRSAPEPGSGMSRWLAWAERLSDCCALVVAQAGETPRRILAEQGVSVILASAQLEPIVDMFYNTSKIKNKSSV